MKNIKTTLISIGTFVLGVAGAIIVKDYSSLSDVIEDLAKQYMANPAIANTLGLATPIGIFVALKIALKKDTEKQKIQIDVSNASQETRALAERIDQFTNTFQKVLDSEIKNNEALQNLNQIMMMFTVNTSIDEKVKNDIIDLYSQVKNNVIDLSKETETFIQKTVENAKELVEKSVETAKEIKKESKSIIDKYMEELKS